MRPTIDEAIEAACRDLAGIRRDLHAHPGLAFAEDHAAATVRRELERAGIPFAGLGRTGIVGWIAPPGTEDREGEVLRRSGLLEGTWCLDPAEGLGPGQADEIDRVIRAYSHLSDDDFVERHRDSWLDG